MPTHACIIKVLAFTLKSMRCPLGAHLNDFFLLFNVDKKESGEIINDEEIVNLDQFIRSV